MKSLIRFLSSVKLAIILLIIITIASILGTLIPQHRSAAEYALRYGQISNLFIRLELTRLYLSWWYLALLLLLTLNIIVCTLSRFSPKWRRAFRPRLKSEGKSLLLMKASGRFKKNWTLEKTKAEVKGVLDFRHFRVREKTEGNRTFLLARKKITGLFGSDIVHLGLLTILAGGILSGFFGLRTSISIKEGQVLPIPEADFSLRLDKFETEYYPNGGVRDWKSTLSVIEKENSVLTKTIEVNHPLSHKGYVFYQSSYGWDWENPTVEIRVKKRNESAFLGKAELKVGEKIKLNSEGIELSLLSFVPDFIIGENNSVQTRSLEPNNPAAFIEGLRDGEKIFSGWIFANYPDFSRLHSNLETDLSFELKDFEAAQYSGIQVAKDPGVNLVWVGCILLMAGLCIAFFWPAREVKIILEDSQGKTEIYAGGIAAKNKEGFQAEFEGLLASLRRLK